MRAYSKQGCGLPDRGLGAHLGDGVLPTLNIHAPQAIRPALPLVGQRYSPARDHLRHAPGWHSPCVQTLGSGCLPGWHLVPDPAVQQAPSLLLVRASPLLEEEGDIGDCAGVPKISNPLGVHRPSVERVRVRMPGPKSIPGLSRRTEAVRPISGSCEAARRGARQATTSPPFEVPRWVDGSRNMRSYAGR